MEALMNPVNSLGERNVFCPHYRTCLDFASKRRWESWDCDSCDYKSIKEPLKDLQLCIDDGNSFYSVGNLKI